MANFDEDPDERRQFDHSARLHGGPLRSIAATLTVWCQMAPDGGSYKRLLAIMANEVTKAADSFEQKGDSGSGDGR